jgi:hypothetical protein
VHAVLCTQCTTQDMRPLSNDVDRESSPPQERALISVDRTCFNAAIHFIRVLFDHHPLEGLTNNLTSCMPTERVRVLSEMSL